jgi:hypothetical protein
VLGDPRREPGPHVPLRRERRRELLEREVEEELAVGALAGVTGQRLALEGHELADVDRGREERFGRAELLVLLEGLEVGGRDVAGLDAGPQAARWPTWWTWMWSGWP